MSDFSYSRAGRLAAEFTVIVIGVLVALFAESWWSERDSRRFESEVRADMVAEFRANLEILAADLAMNEAVRDRYGALVALSDPELLATPDSLFQAWADPAFHSWAVFDPYLGATQALVQSGNLGAVSDQELRLLLSEWAGLLLEKDRYGDMASNQLYDAILPALVEFTADNRWSPEERRKLRTLAGQMLFVTQLTYDNQGRMQATGGRISSYLEAQ